MRRRRAINLLAGVLLASSAAVVALPGVASAHNLSVAFSCNQDATPVLTISLSSYFNPPSGQHNSVSASIDGSTVLATTDFLTAYSNTFSAGSPYVSHTAEVIVFAWDDPSGSFGYTKTFDLTVVNCRQATPGPSATPFESFQQATSTPAPTPTINPCATLLVVSDAVVTPAPSACPFQSFEGATADPTPPPTSTGSDGSGQGSTPLFALLISIAFGALALLAAQAQRRRIRR